MLEMQLEEQGEVQATEAQPIKKTHKNSSFERVMQQMNIADQHELDKQLSQQWQEAAQRDQPVSVLLCSIDFYDQYVENYGIQGASFMLVTVALALKNICDLGGFFLAHNDQQGFTILVKGVEQAEVRAIADNLCAAVKESRTEHKYSKVDSIITLSIGVSGVYPTTMSILEGAARKALQNAKLLGGNKISSDTSEIKVATPTNSSSDIKAVVAEQNSVTQTNKDFFAQPQKQEIKPKPSVARMYRGHVIESADEKRDLSAPNLNAPAPKVDRVDFFADQIEQPIKSKTEEVVMYRGHPVSRGV